MVDGDGGGNSKFFIWGFDFDGVLDLKDGPIWVRPIRKETNTDVIFDRGILKTKIKDNLTEKQNIVIFNATGKLIYRQSMVVNGGLETDVKNYLSPGVNFIKVNIENKTYDQFIFKILK